VAGALAKRGRWWGLSLGVTVVVALVLVALLAPVISPHSHVRQDLMLRLNAPTWEHWFGTDGHGRDVLSRVIWGTRLSLSVAVGAVAIVIILGGSIGVVAGYFGGWPDWVLMRLTDVILSMPALFIALVVVAALGPGAWNTVLVIGALFWPSVARIVRAQTLSLRRLDFTEAARALGATHGRLILRHVLPNVLPIVVVQISLSLARAVLAESGLSFLGVGVQPPAATWGNMLADGRAYLSQAWWIATFPGTAIFLAVLGFNLLGDGLRRVLDPRGT
jgi:peptide/nickel transport system permease protein